MSATTKPLRAAFPTGPLVDPLTGQMTTAWYGFFLSLYSRTGAGYGTSTAALATEIIDETTARQAADAGLVRQLATETATRAGADVVETATRATQVAALEAEKVNRAGDTMSGPLVVLANGAFSTLQTGGAGGPTWTTGTAAPTGTQPIGSLYSLQGGAVGATLYVSRGGGTWLAVAGV